MISPGIYEHDVVEAVQRLDARPERRAEHADVEERLEQRRADRLALDLHVRLTSRRTSEVKRIGAAGGPTPPRHVRARAALAADQLEVGVLERRHVVLGGELGARPRAAAICSSPMQQEILSQSCSALRGSASSAGSSPSALMSGRSATARAAARRRRRPACSSRISSCGPCKNARAGRRSARRSTDRRARQCPVRPLPVGQRERLERPLGPLTGRSLFGIPK